MISGLPPPLPAPPPPENAAAPSPAAAAATEARAAAARRGDRVDREQQAGEDRDPEDGDEAGSEA